MTAVQNLSNQEVIENIKREGIPVVIFGAGIVGEVLFHACRKAGIEVACFCDNNVHKTRSPVCGINVIHAPDLRTKYEDAIFVISAADIRDVVEQLRTMGYFKWHASSLLLKDFDLCQHEFSAPADFVEYAVATGLLCHDNYLAPDRLFLRSVDIIITERCSLKCRDCSNLMQYYRAPADCDTKELLQSIDAFCDIVDEVNEFRIIGGEPFMNKKFHWITKRAIDEPKVKKVVIYTNGTIAPKENQLAHLKNNKVLVLITDYGALSRRLDALTQALLQNGIAYYTQKAQGWADCSKIARHYRNIEQQKEVFRSCCAKNTFTLSKGKLYRCPFSANANRLLAVPYHEGDGVDILQRPQEATGICEMKNRIKRFLLEKDFLQVCDYCNGRPFGAPEMRPAVQTDKPLEYEQYSQ